MSEPTCETCRFWKRSVVNEDWGDCCAHCPRISETLLRVSIQEDGGESPWSRSHVINASTYPSTHYDDWCGEHEPRPKESQ